MQEMLINDLHGRNSELVDVLNYSLRVGHFTAERSALVELVARIEALEADQVEAALFVVDAAGYSVAEAVEIVEGYSYRIHDGNMSDVARQYIEEVYGEDFIFDIVEKAAGRHFAYYMEFDYEGLGRDMRLDGNYYECEDRGKVLEILD